MSVDLLQPMLDAGLSPTDRKRDKYEAIVRLECRTFGSLGFRLALIHCRLPTRFTRGRLGSQGRGEEALMKLYYWVDKPDDVVT